MARAVPDIATLNPAAARAMRGARAMGSLLSNHFFLSLF